MKNALITALSFLLLLSGCRKTETAKTPGIPTVTEHKTLAEASQHPYFHGLIEEYRTILAEDPNNLAALIALGNAYFDSANWPQALIMYEHALLIDVRNADVRTDMGTCYRNMGKPDRALAEYRHALEHDDGHLNARYNMGIVYAYDKKDVRTAIRIWEELLRISPTYPHGRDMRTAMETFKRTMGRTGQ